MTIIFNKTYLCMYVSQVVFPLSCFTIDVNYTKILNYTLSVTMSLLMG